MHAILRRLESGKGGWGAELGVRAFGAALLGLCAAAFWWLRRSMLQPAAHGPGALDFALAALAVAALGLGLAFAFEGPALFKLIPLPGAHAFTP